MFVALGAALAILTGATWKIAPAKADPIEVPSPQAVTAYATAYPAAWYPDPHAPGRERWWDGHRWTWDTREAVPA
jgi:hypothetical protein